MRLKSWPDKYLKKFEHVINEIKQDEAYAVFDADGTLWQGDLSESLLVFLEKKNLLTLKMLTSSMLPIPFTDQESLFSYYLRLCDANFNLGYFWICQVFAGFTLGELKKQIDALIKEKSPVLYRIYDKNDIIIEKHMERPIFFPWIQALISFLKERHIAVYVVTAAQEELVRMVVSDDQYGFFIKPENVVGMKLALKLSPEHRFLTEKEKNLSHGYYKSILTPNLAGQTTWAGGKVAAIKANIHTAQRPIIVAGNSAFDLEMLNYSDPLSGLKLLITKNKYEQAELLKKIDDFNLNKDDWIFVCLENDFLELKC